MLLSKKQPFHEFEKLKIPKKDIGVSVLTLSSLLSTSLSKASWLTEKEKEKEKERE
jgi:hypothetical protein